MAGKTLIIGALGQIGTELTDYLRQKKGASEVVASDIREPENLPFSEEGPFEPLDVMDRERLTGIVREYGISEIYNMAALLSATAEKKKDLAWKLNMEGLFNTLELAREKEIERLYWPSSIAVFGPGTPKENTPQHTVMDPNTVYGISKLAGERWCEYYHQKFGVDVRSLRYPGIVSWKSEPGGGTTDYAVDIYYAALKDSKYVCYLEKDCTLPMMYMPDAIRATVELMEAPAENVCIRSSYNLAAMSLSPSLMAEEISRHIPGFRIEYEPDFRQEIAKGWPASVDDRFARKDWNWEQRYDLRRMSEDMLMNLRSKVKV